MVGLNASDRSERMCRLAIPKFPAAIRDLQKIHTLQQRECGFPANNALEIAMVNGDLKGVDLESVGSRQSSGGEMTALELRVRASKEFEVKVLEEASTGVLALELVLERVPLYFDSSRQYQTWRENFAQGLQVSSRDVLVVGSAATGRSFDPKNQYRSFDPGKSDLDIAVVSRRHFEEAWEWFLRADPFLLGFEGEPLKRFQAHSKHYIYEGTIAAELFLAYFSFGAKWNEELVRMQDDLPSVLRGRKTSIRIYRDSNSLLRYQSKAVESYRRSKSAEERVGV